MRAMLWLIVVLLVIAAIALAVFLMKVKPGSIAIPKVGLGDVVNLVLLLIAVAALIISIAAFTDGQRSAQQQQESLDASRKALESVVQKFTDQQALMEQNLAMSRTQLAVVQEQWKREQENQAKRARIEIITLNDTPWDVIQNDGYKVSFEFAAGNHERLTFVLRNTGTIGLIHPILIFTATPASVFVDYADTAIGRTNHNILQISGINVPDIHPYSQTGINSIVSVDVTVPDTISNYDLSLQISGENLDAPWLKTLHVTPIRKPQN